MARIGKKRAGRLLDGREWNEYPRYNGQTQDGDPLLPNGGTDAGLRVQAGTGSTGRTQE